MEEPSYPLIERELEAADNDGFSLIDGSELDDLLVSIPGASFVDNKVNMLHGGVNMPERPEAEVHKKKEKYNLRKSLAWDSAFFTSAGVLDAEELSSIIEGNNDGKPQMQHLPAIQEDISKSTDSLSTLESDNLTLESLEADLFCDIRASIQRSGESSKLRKSNFNEGLEETDSGNQPGTKTIELQHGNTVKAKSASKKPNTSLQGDGKLKKLGPVREQVRKPVGSRRVPNSSLLKSPAVSGKGSSMAVAPAKVPAKRMSITAGRIKSDTVNVGNATGRGTTLSKGSRPGDSQSIVSKAASYSKSSSGSSTTARKGISSTRSSYDSTSSCSSESCKILPLNGLQGKPDRTARVAPPGSRSKIPSRVPLKGKIQSGTSHVSAYLSTPKLSPSVSPTSSISEWSSSSSTATFSQEHSVSKDSSNLHRTISLDSNASQDLQMHPIKQTPNEHENEATRVPKLSAQKSLGSNGSLSDPVSAKPSGLRMPSPKIGFFDGVKAGARTPNAVGSMQSRSGLPSSRFPRSTTGSSSPSGVSNKGRMGHATVKATVVAAGNFNPDTQKSNARMTATGGRLEGKSTAAEKALNGTTSKDVRETTSLKIKGDNNSVAAKLPDGGMHFSESGSSSRKKSGLVSLKRDANPEGDSDIQGNHLSSAAEDDHHPVETCDDSEVLKTHLLHELDTINTELQLVNMSQEVRSAVTSDDQNVVVVSMNGGNEATTLNPERDSDVKGNQLSSAAEADRHPVETCDDSEVLKTHLLHESDTINTDLQLVNVSEEDGSAVTSDDKNVVATMIGGTEATTLKHDPICVVATDQQLTGLSAYVEAMGNKNELCEEMHGNLESQSNVKSVGHSQVPVLSCAVELSGFNQKEEAEDLPKQTDFSVSPKKLESNPGSRTPFADKNSSSDANAMEVLVKSFTSLSLDSVQAKDVEI